MDKAFMGCSNLTTVISKDGPVFVPGSSLNNMFNGCSAFNADLHNWDLSGVTQTADMFYGASVFNGDISNWDVSNVWNMSGMFENASAFNGKIGQWNVANVTRMDALFWGASAFNQNINDWNVGKVTDFYCTFCQAKAFNQDLDKWNVSSAQNMGYMFREANAFNGKLGTWNTGQVTYMLAMFLGASAFNQDISGWEVSNVTNMSTMFAGASAFNQNISSWDVSSVTNMSNMFLSASAFNGDISGWDVSNVTDMSSMFLGARTFNKDISRWDVSSVTNMKAMFQAAGAFNSDISKWDVSHVTNMGFMFCAANSFNVDISGWDVAQVKDMGHMFDGATAFDQNLGEWRLQEVTDLSMMISKSGLSATNYEKTLTGWATQNLPNNITLGVDGLTYCSSTARQYLIDTYGWTIAGDRQTCFVPAHPDAAGVVYVDSSIASPGDGHSWQSALKYLSNATVSSTTNMAIKEIHVAKGTYFPTGNPHSSNRDSSFILNRSGLRLLGGYPSGGGGENARDYQANPTLLSGDLGIADDTSDNSFHVMLILDIPAGKDSLIVDGFTLMRGNNGYLNMDGYEDSRFSPGQAAGVFITNAFSNTVMRNCSIVDNFALFGAGMVIKGQYGDPLIPATPQIIHCLFKRNITIAPAESGGATGFGYFGGGLFAMVASPFISNCTFTENESQFGAALSINTFSEPTIINSVISGNNGAGASALYNLEGSHATLVNCQITNNKNTGFGDEQAPTGEGSTTVDANDLFGNVVIMNTLVSSTRLINCTVAGNYSTVSPASGSANILNIQNSSLYITNSVFWGNQSTKILDSLQSTTKIAYSLMQGMAENPAQHNLDGRGDYNLFTNAPDQNYQLNLASPAINTGFNDSLLLVLATLNTKGLGTGLGNLGSGGMDLMGNPRIFGSTETGAGNGIVDLGALEFQGKKVHPGSHGILYVSSAAAPGGDGSSWGTALSTMDTALYSGAIINQNANGTTADSLRQIWVAAGTYQPAASHSFAMLPKVKIYGSFQGNESSLDQRRFGADYSSVLLGNGTTVIRNENNGLDSAAVLDGFLVTGGSAGGNSELSNGGGIYNSFVSPTFNHLEISKNTASYEGGGMANISAAPLLMNVMIKENNATFGGGGMYNRQGAAPILFNTLISNNSSKYGGGFFNSEATVLLTSVTITGNTASGHGGGMSSSNSVIDMKSSILWNNQGNDQGNELFNAGCSVTLSSILYRDGDENIHNEKSSTIGLNGTQIMEDPAFMDPENNNYQLSAISPAINQGNNGDIPIWDSIDLIGQLRIIDKTVDLGAYEYIGASLPVKMSDLKGQVNTAGHAVLRWTTFMETDNRGFQVQQSTDGMHFENSQFIASLAKGGNSTVTQLYNCDAGSLNKVTYFRLQQTDLDGKHTTTSNIVRLQPATAVFKLKAYPNPARNYIHLRIEGGVDEAVKKTSGQSKNAMIEVMDYAGRVLIRQKVTGTEIKINLSNLSAGIYLIKYTHNGNAPEQSAVIRIVKQ